jgi:hypothetical protein
MTGQDKEALSIISAWGVWFRNIRQGWPVKVSPSIGVNFCKDRYFRSIFNIHKNCAAFPYLQFVFCNFGANCNRQKRGS